METDNEYQYTLVCKHLLGTLSEAESHVLNQWLLEKREHRTAFDDIVFLWKRSGNFTFPEKIKSKQALRTVHEKLGIKKQKAFRLNLAQIAAVLLLSVTLSGVFSYYYTKHNPWKSDVYQEISAAYGTRTKIDLTDGTTVTLNSGSSLRYPTQLIKNNERTVELKGEGFFEVAKNKQTPFVVHTDKLAIQVLGTTFNVSAYQPDTEVEITLVEGQVAIADVRKPQSEKLMILNPKEKALFDAGKNTIIKESVVNLEKYVGWVDGKIVFVDDPIHEVVKKLGNWYNADIRIENERLMNFRFTGTFINEPLEGILSILSKTSPFRYEIRPVRMNKAGEYSKREVILK